MDFLFSSWLRAPNFWTILAEEKNDHCIKIIEIREEGPKLDYKKVRCEFVI